MHNGTITLFNRKVGKTGDMWYPTVLHGVQVILGRSAVAIKYGSEASDNAAVHVRYTVEPDSGIKTVGEKQWLPPKMWAALDDPSHAVTFAEGTQFDFFWVGAWSDENPVADADYVSHGDFYTYMNKTHDYVYAISSVDGPFSVIPHFEIRGK